MGPCGVTGHQGADTTWPWDRAKRYISYYSMGENLAFAPYADTDGMNVMKGLVVDDGVANRGH